MTTRAATAAAGVADAHPAVIGWRAHAGTKARPLTVETIARSEKSAVYRLCGAAGRGAAVIAKAQSVPGWKVERAVYETVLPRLPVAAPRCYGAIEDPEGWFWVFLEDAAGRAFAPSAPADRVLAGQWLGDLHAAAAGMTAPSSLPRNTVGGLSRAAARVRERCLSAARRRSVLDPDRRLLTSLARRLDVLVETISRDLEECLIAIPPVLTHGDFCAKNLRVRRGRVKSELCVFDWDMASWGVCSPDMAQDTLQSATPDLRTYWRTIRRAFPQLGLRTVRNAARAGSILRIISAIEWELAKSRPLRDRWLFDNLRQYDSLLRGRFAVR